MFAAETKVLFATVNISRKTKVNFLSALSRSFVVRLTNYLFWFLLQIIQFLGNY